MKTSDTNCRFFNGFQNDKCEAGINYRELNGGTNDACAIRLPCCGAFQVQRQSEPVRIECPTYQPKTAEEIAEREREIAAAMDRMMKVGPWASQIKKLHGKRSQREDVCPICGKRIRFAIASNFHMRAKCETDGCVNFIE